MLFLTPQTWIHRRVEAVEFYESGETKRSVSIDFTLTPAHAVPGSEHRLIIPIAFLEKTPLRALDASDSSGRSLPVLETRRNGEFSVQLLGYFARSVLRKVAPAESSQLDVLIESIVLGEPAIAEQAMRDLESRSFVQAQASDVDVELFLDVAASFARHFVLMVEVPDEVVGTRSLVKFSYEMPMEFTRSRSIEYWLDLGGPQLWMSGSCHMELRTPAGVRTCQLTVREDTTGVEWSDPACQQAASLHIAHVACSSETPLAAGSTEAAFLPDNPSLVMTALVSGWVVALVMFGVPIVALVNQHWNLMLFPSEPLGSAASLILVGPALLFAYLGRSPEHQLVARVLWPIRKSILVTGIVLLAAAGLVATRIVLPFAFAWAWCGLGVIQSFFAIRMTQIYAAVRAPR